MVSQKARNTSATHHEMAPMERNWTLFAKPSESLFSSTPYWLVTQSNLIEFKWFLHFWMISEIIKGQSLVNHPLTFQPEKSCILFHGKGSIRVFIRKIYSYSITLFFEPPESSIWWTGFPDRKIQERAWGSSEKATFIQIDHVLIEKRVASSIRKMGGQLR